MKITRKRKTETPEEPGFANAWELLDCAPPIPHIRRMEDAIAFVDKFTQWKRKVESRK